ncbi:hypothetical protein Tco_0575002 [Tanacetum coccineum]
MMSFTEADVNIKELADIQRLLNILVKGSKTPIQTRLNQPGDGTRNQGECRATYARICKYVTIVKNSQDITNVSYFNLYTHLKSYEQHAMKTLSKMNQSSGNIDPLAYMAQATKTSSHTSSQQYSPSVPPQSPQSTNDAMLATMNQIEKLVDHVTNVVVKGTYARECKEKKREKDSQWFKDKALLMEAKEKGAILDAEAEAFLADVECTTPYVKPLAITTTTTFKVSHEDAYDSDVDEAPYAAAAFMANLTGTSNREGTSNNTDFHSEVHTHNNHFFENINHQVIQAMHQEEQLDSDVDSDIDDYDNIIPYHQYQSNTEVENVPTEVSSMLSDQISIITIPDDMMLKLEGYMNTNKEQSLANDSLKAELERYKTQVESNKSLKTESEKLKTDNKARKDSYQEELVWLRHANKVVTELLQSYGQPVQTVHMLSKRPTFASKDLHKTSQGRSNPKYLKTAQLSQPALYRGDIVVNPLHTPHRVHDNEDTLVHAEVSRTKMLEKIKDPECIEDNLFKEVSEYMKFFDELDKEYDQCVIDKKCLEIENKNLLIQNECLLAESISKDICSVVLTPDNVVPISVWK